MKRKNFKEILAVSVSLLLVKIEHVLAQITVFMGLGRYKAAYFTRGICMGKDHASSIKITTK
jgi:hypothetical protein